MKFLVDTCVISELIKQSPNKKVEKWISSIDEDNLYISVLTIGEIRKGITKLPESKKKKELFEWLKNLEVRFQGKIIPIDVEVASRWGFVQGQLEEKGNGMPSIDGLIASTALSKGLIVVTRNSQDIKRSGVELLDPWE